MTKQLEDQKVFFSCKKNKNVVGGWIFADIPAKVQPSTTFLYTWLRGE